MAQSLNKAELIGNLGKDPEMRYTPNGQAVVNFSVATNRSWQDASGEWQSKADWHNITAWGKLAEFCNGKLTKGSKVYLEGRIEYQSWEQDGQKRYKTVIIANSVIPLSGGNEGGDGEDDGGSREEFDDLEMPF